MGSRGTDSSFESLWSTLSLGTEVHDPVLQSHNSHQGGPGFPERGCFNFCFWKVLSQEGQRLEKLLDAAEASVTGTPRCLFSLALNQL